MKYIILSGWSCGVALTGMIHLMGLEAIYFIPLLLLVSWLLGIIGDSL